MGNAGSSSGRPHHDDSVDYGSLSPQGVYTGPKDWNHPVVTQLIVDRKLAPFYRPLEDYNDDWDDDQILAARKDFPDSDSTISDASAARPDQKPSPAPKRTSTLKEPSRCPEAALYRGAVDCPICFLYYPPNINRSRCCDQAICTECFVQIKRTEPTATHLVSEPAACPYCVQDNFGIVYTPPPWRVGIGSDGMIPPSWADPLRPQQGVPGPSNIHKRRRKSFGHDSPEVVTTDQIRPDWEAKLAAVRAAVARRANRRIIMRQVGDRLIPVGVTSGRVHALPTTDGADGQDGENGSPAPVTGSRRRRGPRANGQTDLSQLLGQMGLGGQDLEELMVMEAMRLSLIEHEAQQRREEERARREGVTNQTNTEGSSATSCVDESAPSRTQSGATAPSVVSLFPRADDPSAARSRSSTPVSGQTDSSSPRGTTVDDLNDIPYSTERSSGQLTLTTGTLTPIGNGEVHAVHAASNDERSRSLCSTSILGRSQRSEDFAGTIMTSCTPLSSSSSDTDPSEHP
ncbi:hypothetical protein JVT61DRAFT_2163 [Boletus reticuloceps]|uniref:RING-type domain-containing protein n=1 Tax=Boletus reticuloceps TaxID=495285 RepID=A0A8I3AAE2_9AGAM|nr:hypothetical protein JVT61DRAFT_2163 [Boletus reticuloceps]